MSTRARTYTLIGVINDAVDARLAHVHTACPGRVVKYDATKQMAEVQPLVMVSYTNEAGDDILEALPVLVGVPIIFPGGGGFRVTFPVKADAKLGDTCLVVFTETSLDRWLTQGGDAVDPADDRRFHLSDAVAFVGLRDFAHALASARADAMTLGDDVGLQIHIDKTRIQLGTNDPSLLEAATLADTLTTHLAAMRVYIATHTHPVSGAVAGAPNGSAPTVPNIASSKVQVQK